MDINYRISSFYQEYKADFSAAQQAQARGNLEGARKLYRKAALALCEMAKLESGETRRARTLHAEEIMKMADSLQAPPALKPKNAGSGTAQSQTPARAGDGNDDNPWQSEGIPDTTFDDVVGMEDVKKLIRAQVIDQIKYPELYSQYGVTGGTGVLLYGLPGTGKTTVARAIAHEIGAPLYTVQLSDVLSKWVGESEKRVSQLFDAARSHPVSLIFFDDFDALGRARQEGPNGQHGNQVLVELINQMDGFKKNENTIVLLAATNKPWMIDSALLRARRFEHHFYVPLPEHNARIALVKKTLGEVPVDPALDYDRVSELLKGYNGADIVAVVNIAKVAALERAKALRLAGQEDALSPVNQQDFEQAADGHKSSVVKSDIDQLRKYAREQGLTLPDEL